MGIVCVVLMMALGSMGTAYGLWSKTLSISGTVSTAVIDTIMIWSSSQAIPPGIGYVNLGGVPSARTLDVHIVNAQAATDYYCYFLIVNNPGSLPVKIQSVTITPPVADWQTTYGFNGSVTFDGGTKTPVTVIGEQIDPGETMDGTVHVFLDGADVGSNFDVTIVVDVVLWNLYVP